MTLFDTIIKNPALRYPGSTWNLIEWHLSFVPPHYGFISPFAGSATEFLRKKPSKLDVYNDLNGDLVNFFRVLRERPDELIAQIELTPYARAEHEYCLQPCDDPLERARRFYVVSWQSFKPNDKKLSWRCHKSMANKKGDLVRYTNSAIDFEHGKSSLVAIADKFRGVEIENVDGIEMAADYGRAGNFLYCNPPYVTQTVESNTHYQNGQWPDSTHLDLFNAMQQNKGMAMVCGYASKLYTDTYEAAGWERHDRKARTSGKDKIESVWLCPKTQAALKTNGKQGRLI